MCDNTRDHQIHRETNTTNNIRKSFDIAEKEERSMWNIEEQLKLFSSQFQSLILINLKYSNYTRELHGIWAAVQSMQLFRVCIAELTIVKAKEFPNISLWNLINIRIPKWNIHVYSECKLSLRSHSNAKDNHHCVFAQFPVAFNQHTYVRYTV